MVRFLKKCAVCFRVEIAAVFSCTDPITVDSSYGFRLAPCLKHTPQRTTLFEHPSILESLTCCSVLFAQYSIHRFDLTVLSITTIVLPSKKSYKKDFIMTILDISLQKIVASPGTLIFLPCLVEVPLQIADC